MNHHFYNIVSYFWKKNKRSENTFEVCVICWEPRASVACANKKKKHFCHAECIQKWKRIKEEEEVCCPVCSSKIHSVKETPVKKHVFKRFFKW